MIMTDCIKIVKIDNYIYNKYPLTVPNAMIGNRKLPGKANMLYAYIKRLAKKYGYCYATNDALAKKFNVTTRTIGYWLKALKDQGYIIIQQLYDKYKPKWIVERRIYVKKLIVVDDSEEETKNIEEAKETETKIDNVVFVDSKDQNSTQQLWKAWKKGYKDFTSLKKKREPIAIDSWSSEEQERLKNSLNSIIPKIPIIPKTQEDKERLHNRYVSLESTIQALVKNIPKGQTVYSCFFFRVHKNV